MQRFAQTPKPDADDIFEHNVDQDNDFDLVLGQLDKDLDNELSSDGESLGVNTLYQLKKSMQGRVGEEGTPDHVEPSPRDGQETGRIPVVYKGNKNKFRL